MGFGVRPEAVAVLTAEDHAVLHAIYRHRCLSEEQITNFFYGNLDNGKNGYTINHINTLIEVGFIISHEYKPTNWVYFLTYHGVQYVRSTSKRLLYTTKEKSGKRRYEATAGTLILPDGMLDHQCRLNDLALTIIYQTKLDPDCYKDNLFARNFTYAQPDAVIEFPSFDLFLEMDMGHERLNALRNKWKHYRAYFRSKDYQLYRNKRIIVLFATENVQKLYVRRNSIVKSIAQTSMDLLGPMFECYIGSNKIMESVAKQLLENQCTEFQQIVELIKSSLQVQTANPEWLSKICWGNCVILQLQNGFPILVVDGLFGQMSILKLITYFGQTQQALSSTAYRGIKLLVLVSSEIDICRDLMSAEIRLDTDAFYTTKERLLKHSFHEAVFVFDQLGNRYHFADAMMQTLCYEKQQCRVRQKYKKEG